MYSYLRAAEVGRGPTSPKYELAVVLRTSKNTPVVRNRIRLPYPVRGDLRIAVICPPDSNLAAAALSAGAAVVGEDSIFDAVRDGRIEFDRCICHTDSLPKLGKANLGRILGPKGLMPSARMGTVTNKVANSVRDLVGSTEYKERDGVVRFSVGQLGSTPDELQRNIKVAMESVRAACAAMANLEQKVTKEIHEIILSSTNGPGMSLSGEMSGPNSIPSSDLATL